MSVNVAVFVPGQPMAIQATDGTQGAIDAIVGGASSQTGLFPVFTAFYLPGSTDPVSVLGLPGTVVVAKYINGEFLNVEDLDVPTIMSCDKRGL